MSEKWQVKKRGGGYIKFFKKFKKKWEWNDKQVKKEQNTKQQETRFAYPCHVKFKRMTTENETEHT